MRFLADLVYLLAGTLYAPVLAYQVLVHRKNRRGWVQRFGFVPQFDPARPRIWIHAVSLGEINTTPKLVEALQARLPNVEIVFSTTTDTGFARAVQLYGAERVFRFPLDFSFAVRRAISRITPRMIVLVELEVWYNLVRQATRRGVAVAVVNGRLTERSARRLGFLNGAARAMFAELAWVGAQDTTIASRFRSLGTPADRVDVTSSLKWDSATVAETVPGATELAEALGISPDRSVWVCGSTGPGEEAVILDAYRLILARFKNPARRVQESPVKPMPAEPPVLVLVPRKPERFEEVARLVERSGWRCVRRSQPPVGAGADVELGDAVVLGDTMGELRKFYALASVVFVGRTLVPMGGSDPMEVAALGKPILLGPHVDNFASPVAMLQDGGAVRRVRSGGELAEAVMQLVGDPESARRTGAKAREVVRRAQGATARTAAALFRLYERTAAHADAASG